MIETIIVLTGTAVLVYFWVKEWLSEHEAKN